MNALTWTELLKHPDLPDWTLWVGHVGNKVWFTIRKRDRGGFSIWYGPPPLPTRIPEAERRLITAKPSLSQAQAVAEDHLPELVQLAVLGREDG